MGGMSRSTGHAMTGLAHLAQSIADILTTPLGSRIARRDYGSQLPDLMDAPVNAKTRVRLFSATATALMRWETRIVLQRVALSPIDGAAGRWQLDITGRLADSANPLSLSVPLNLTGSKA